MFFQEGIKDHPGDSQFPGDLHLVLAGLPKGFDGIDG
jgi:hypothetical protein